MDYGCVERSGIEKGEPLQSDEGNNMIGGKRKWN